MELNLKNSIIKIIFDFYDIKLNDLKLTKPPKNQQWDYAFNCGILSKDLKRSPIEIANELILELQKIDIISEVFVSWGFINLKIDNSIFTETFLNIYKEKKLNDFSDFWKWEKIIVDYIWANVWKPLHIGHMCTPNQWQTMINIYKKLWYDVISDSHIWDRGIIFWKLITAFKIWWDEKKLKENAVDYLLELYIKITSEIEIIWEELEQRIRAEFKLLSEGNCDSIKLWEKFTSYSIKSMNKQLARLNIKPDFNIWESFYEWIWLPKIENYPDLTHDMHSIVSELIEKKIAIKNDDNSVWVEFDEKTKIPSCILQKRDWTHWYLASDLAAIKYRTENWTPKKIIYFVDARQQMHLKQTFEIAKQAWYLWQTELFHAYNWFISLKDGAMSTRKWKIIKLDKLLDESEKRAKNIILEKRDDIKWDELENLSKIIWIWAIKYWYLKKSRETDVIFDWNEFMSFEGNSWPYIQYSYVRAIKILQKSNINFKNIDFNLKFEQEEEIELIKLLWDYRKILELSTIKNTPHLICKYSYDLTKAFGAFYNNVRVLDENNEDKKIMKLQLVDLYSQVLNDSFTLLWIDMPNKM